jgi:hypothetical protein
MNEIDFGAAVLISSAAGWYAGFYFERQKARRAFSNLISQSIESTSKLANAAVSLMMTKNPEANPDELVQELMKEGQKYGMNAVAVPRKKSAQMIKDLSNDNDKA